MTNPIWETMTCWTDKHGYRVRVWREEPNPKFGPDREVLDAIESLDPYTERVAIPLLIHVIAQLPRIAAIEVVNPQGNGTIFYPDWK